MLFCEASDSCVCPLSDLRKLKKSYIQLFAKKQTSLLNGEPFVLSCLAYFICHAHPMLSFPSMSHILCLSRARVVSVNFKTWKNTYIRQKICMSKGREYKQENFFNFYLGKYKGELQFQRE